MLWCSLGLQPACLLTAVILPRRGWERVFASLFSPLPQPFKLSSYAKMLICKEIRVGGLEESLSGRVTHQHLQIVNLIETLTLLGQLPEGRSEPGAKFRWLQTPVR